MFLSENKESIFSKSLNFVYSNYTIIQKMSRKNYKIISSIKIHKLNLYYLIIKIEILIAFIEFF